MRELLSCKGQGPLNTEAGIYSIESRNLAAAFGRGNGNWNWNSGRGKTVLLSTSCRPVVEPTHPPIQWLSSGVKRPELETNHSPPTSADVKHSWIYAFTLQYVFMA
jgi:hypothetical protein